MKLCVCGCLQPVKEARRKFASKACYLAEMRRDGSPYQGLITPAAREASIVVRRATAVAKAESFPTKADAYLYGYALGANRQRRWWLAKFARAGLQVPDGAL